MRREHFQCQGQKVSCPITGFKLSFGDADKITNPAPSHIVSLILTACSLIAPFPTFHTSAAPKLHVCLLEWSQGQNLQLHANMCLHSSHQFPFCVHVVTLYICIKWLLQGLFSARHKRHIRAFPAIKKTQNWIKRNVFCSFSAQEADK